MKNARLNVWTLTDLKTWTTVAKNPLYKTVLITQIASIHHQGFGPVLSELELKK